MKKSAAFGLLMAVSLCGCGGISVNLPGPEKAEKNAEGGAPHAASTPAPALKAEPNPSSGLSEQTVIEEVLRQVQTGKAGYKIGPADLLEIKVFREHELQRSVRVSPSGAITFPLIGNVQLGGLDVAEAEGLISEKLKQFIYDPQVSVLIMKYGNKIVYVLGEVQHPGSIALPTEAPLSVLEAVTLTGGFTPYAALDGTRGIRKQDGKSQSFVIEITAITKKGDKSKDMVLMANDVVYVPESFF